MKIITLILTLIQCEENDFNPIRKTVMSALLHDCFKLLDEKSLLPEAHVSMWSSQIFTCDLILSTRDLFQLKTRQKQSNIPNTFYTILFIISNRIKLMKTFH